MDTYVSQEYFCVSEYNEAGCILNSALRFSVPSRYRLYQLHVKAYNARYSQAINREGTDRGLTLLEFCDHMRVFQRNMTCHNLQNKMPFTRLKSRKEIRQQQQKKKEIQKKRRKKSEKRNANDVSFLTVHSVRNYFYFTLRI